MLEKGIEFIQSHAEHAHYFIFGATLLAGLNIPISIDLLMILSATLAATVIPAHLYHLFFGMLLGCLLSAWISYGIGRLVGTKIIALPLFSKLFSAKRLAKVDRFYKKRGFYAFIIGRFIPFGIRNCLFMSSGMSHIPFGKFALWDGIAGTIWCTLSYFCYYLLGKNAQAMYQQVKVFNLFIFLAFGVTVIGLIWYKKRKPLKEKDV